MEPDARRHRPGVAIDEHQVDRERAPLDAIRDLAMPGEGKPGRVGRVVEGETDRACRPVGHGPRTDPTLAMGAVGSAGTLRARGWKVPR